MLCWDEKVTGWMGRGGGGGGGSQMVGKLLRFPFVHFPFFKIMFSAYEAEISFFYRDCQLVLKSSCSSSISATNSLFSSDI